MHWVGTIMEFLGHLVGEGTISIPQHRVETLSGYTKLVTKKELRSFLGAVGFYGRDVELLAKETAVLTPLTSKLALSRVVWTREGESAFHNICMYISNAGQLTKPLPEDAFSIITDASRLGIGRVLQVRREAHWEVAAFCSRQTKGAKQRYSATELEAFILSDIFHTTSMANSSLFSQITSHCASSCCRTGSTPDCEELP